MNLLEMLLGTMAQDSSVDTIATKTNADRTRVYKLILAALPILLFYLTRNASKKEGADSLMNALGNHTSKENLAKQVANADTDDGAKILKHILGQDESAVTGNLAKQSGLDPDTVIKVLSMLAPSVLSGLSAATSTAKTKKSAGFDLSDGIDMNDVMSLFGGQTQKKQTSGIEDLLGSFLGGGQQKQSSGVEDIIGSLLGGGTQKKSTFDGSDLIKMLANFM